MRGRSPGPGERLLGNSGGSCGTTTSLSRPSPSGPRLVGHRILAAGEDVRRVGEPRTSAGAACWITDAPGSAPPGPEKQISPSRLEGAVAPSGARVARAEGPALTARRRRL